MATPSNAVTTTEMNAALDAEFIANFNGEYDRLAEILGIFSPEVMQAGQVLNQIKITGTLADAADYAECDEVPLSKFQTEKVPVDQIKVEPYRRLTSANSINKVGYEVAVMRTDAKMVSTVRSKVMDKFFTFMENGTGTATAKTLQAALAKADAALGDKLEENNDETTELVHFVNRQDAADYLGNANVTTQNMFGLTYLQDFLGVQRVFLTNKVEAGSLFVTPVENIHVYGLDFANLASAGLPYATESNGLIGVAHTPAYNRVSVETNVINGTVFFPEVQDYIVKATIAPGA